MKSLPKAARIVFGAVGLTTEPFKGFTNVLTAITGTQIEMVILAKA
jgi:hypothetical protein